MRARAVTRCAALLGSIVCAGMLTAGCSLPTSVTGVPDAGTGEVPDTSTGTMDTGVGVDAFVLPGVDASVVADDAFMPGIDAFTPPVDAWSPPPDAFTPPDDAWSSPPDAGNPCTDAFANMASGYEFCASTAGSCTFYLVLGSGTDCSDVCARTGRTCTAAIENNATNHCMSMGGAQTCSHNMTDGICTCSFP